MEEKLRTHFNDVRNWYKKWTKVESILFAYFDGFYNDFGIAF